MLIKALCEYYDLKAEKNPSSLPNGYDEQDVHYLVLLRENGEIADIVDYRLDEELPQKNGKNKIRKVPRKVALPQRSQKSAVFSALVEHRPLYLFGLNYANGELTADDKTNKARKSHEAFVNKNSEFFAELNSPVCAAFRNFILNFDPENETENTYLKSLGKDYGSAYFSFALYDDPTKTPQDDPEFLAEFERRYAKENSVSDNAYKAVCPVLGRELPTARIHDKIKFPGGNTTGCVLVGMKETAYESFGKTQSYNSNISEEAMKKYTAAFNDLLGDKRHRVIINSMVIVFFALKSDDSAETDMFMSLFGASEKGDEDEAFFSAVNALKSGGSIDYSALDIDPDVDFYIAGFTPNSSRICQKFFVHNSFGKIMENAAQHQRDLELAENTRQVRFNWIARELISPKSSKDEVPPPLMTGIIRAALEGANYPAELLQRVIVRIKTDSDDDKNRFIKFNATRVGIIKACLNRRARKSGKEEDIKMSLNTNDTHAGYLCGRLFAVLEKIQQDSANGTLNSTIVGSYFSSACAKPSAVFPRLIELSVHHQRKLVNGLQVIYQKLIGEIIDKLDGQFPAALNLDDQGRFIVGYYQQNRDLWTSKENKNNDKEN